MSEGNAGDPIPEHLAALIPDVVESPGIPPEARKAVAEMEEDMEDRGDKMVAAMKSIPSAPVALNGIFRHPPEFTEQEWDIIIAGLKAQLPLYAIAMKVHCERHFLAKKIAEMRDVAQVALDAKEGMLDETEYQLVKAIRTGSLAAIMYYLDHHGQSRGYGDAQDKKDLGEEVQINFGEISQADLQEGARLVAEAQKKTTPTLAGELAAIEEVAGAVPGKISPQQLAAAEDTVKAMQQTMERKQVDISQATVSPPPYEQMQSAKTDEMSERYDFLENAFSDGGDSPFSVL